MKSRVLLLYLTLQASAFSIVFSQNIAINTTGNLPDTSAMLDIVSTSKGFLMPRMTTAQMNAIILPSNGLLIFNTTDNEFKVNIGSTGTPNWVPLISSASAGWALTGNSGSNSGNNFIGTTDNKSFRLRTNNTERVVVDSNGRVGIGTNAPAADFTIFQSAGTGASRGIRLAGNSIGGTNAGTGFALSLGFNSTNNKQLWLGDADYLGNASGNFIRYTSVGTSLPTLDGINGNNSTRKYVALGVAGDANSGVIFGNDGSATNPGSMVWTNGNMAIGNSYRASAAPTNGLLVQGNMGIGTNAPGSALDIKGTLRLSGSTSGYVGFAPAAAAGSTTYTLPSADGTNGQSLTTNGSGLLSWIAPTASSWSLTGNSGTTAGTNFIGTTDNTMLRFKINGIARMHLDQSGGLFVGDSASSYSNTVSNTQAGLRSDWSTSLLAADTPRIALQGQVRVNVTSSSIANSVRGLNGSALVGVNNGVTSTADLYGGYFLARRQTSSTITEGTGTLASLAGIGIEYGHTATANASGTTTNVYGIKLNPIYATGNITNLYGLYTSAPSSTGATVTNSYDIYLSNHTPAGVTNPWGIYQANTKVNYFAGNTGFGTTSPGSALDVKGTVRLSGSTSGYVGLAPAAAAGSTTYTLPAADGSSGQSLTTNGSGTLSWAASSATAWSKTGNSSTTPVTNFIGTTDSVDFVTKTNGTERMRVAANGKIAIGTSTFDATNPEKVLIDAGTTTSVNALYIKGSIDNYMQLNISNKSSGTQASSDIVATANNGTETTNFMNMGINGGSYVYQNGNPIETGKANDGYIISAGNDMYVVNNNATKSMLFLTGGTANGNERMRIQSDGRIGIGVTDPTSQFVVKDTMEIRRTTSSPLSQLLFSNTAGAGDFRIGGDGGDLYWQGGGGRSLQMGSYWTTILGGDRQTATYPAYVSSLGGTGVLVQSQRSASIPLAIQGATSQTANLTEWRNAAGTVLNIVNASGQLGIGTTAPGSALDIKGTLRLSGSTSGYVGFAPAAAAGSTTYTLPAADGTTGQYLSTNGSGLLSWASTSANDWSKTGNTGTTAGTNYIGTGDAIDFVTKTNGAERMRVTSGGKVGINNTAPDETLTVGNSTAAPFAIKLGNSSGILRIGVANSVSDYGMIAAGDVMIENLSNKALAFGTNGDNIRMYISNGGNVGIGNTAPNSTLSVNGSLTVGYRTSSSNATLTAADYAVIHTGGSGFTWSIPAANTCAGRVYRLINHGTASITLSVGYKPDNASGLVTTLASSAGTNMVEIISDGTNWRRIL